MNFEQYWAVSGVHNSGPGVLDAAFKELAQKAWYAAVSAERDRCIEIVDRELDSNGNAQAISLAIRG